MDDLFSITAHSDAGHTILTAAGEFDLLAVATFTTCAEAALNAPDVVIDLAAVSFMDSSGLNALLLLQQNALARNGSLTLRSPTDRVRRLFDVAGLIDVFSIEH